MSAISSLSIIVLSLIGGGWQIKKAKGPPRRAALYTWMISRSIRSCLDFISALVGKTFCIDFFSRSAANSGLFARIERKKMPKRISNKPNSLFSNKSAIKSKQLISPRGCPSHRGGRCRAFHRHLLRP